MRSITSLLMAYTCFCGICAGISITAGHDCLFEQSYPVLLNATMSRIMATAGVR